jgi:asparagine synthase (glutamine-hydrolysing)
VTAIAGLWSFGGRPGADRGVDRMLRAQQVYGPEQPAAWSDGELALGRRLFSLLPEDRFDRGPVTWGGGGHALVADLRIDNRDELRTALGIAEAEAKALSDAALLAGALERWGEDAVQRIVGDFAFAWWDAARRRLLLARDPFGERPLHYHRGNGFFAFATMPKGLHALEEIPVAPNRQRVATFLAQIPDSGSESFFEGVEKVIAGHLVTVTADGTRSRRWWNPEPSELRLGSDGDYEEAMREQFDRAVASRLRGSGGRVGAHLSAGLDSSAVAATAARLLAPEQGSVTAFTAVPREGYPVRRLRDGIMDEGPLAGAVAAAHPNIEHVLIRTGGKSPLDDLGRYFFLFERPFLNLCNGVWYTAILEEARRRGLKVVLTGAMGNASFSYDGLERLSQLMRRGRLLRLAGEAVKLRRRGTRLGTIAAQAIGPFLPARAWRAIARLRGADASVEAWSLLPRGEADALRIEAAAAERGLDAAGRPRSDPVEARLWMLRRLDGGNYKKGALAGWGIDQRDPAIDRRLVEFCLSLPAEQFLAGGWTRSLARRAFRDRVPEQVLHERRKGRQAADWHEGLAAARASLSEEIDAIRTCAPAAGALDTARMQRLVADWPADGNWHSREVERDYRHALLRGISAGRFIRNAMGANR